MQLKFLLICFLAVSLLVSLSEAGKDRRKKQKQKERNEEDETNSNEVSGGKGMEDSGKGKDDKERTSVLEKQSEKKEDNDESSSEEKDEKDEDDKKNSTIIIRKKRSEQTVLSRVVREARQVWGAKANSDDGYVLPTDPVNKFKRDTIIQTGKAKELNDGAQIPLEKKPAATASPSN